MLSIKKMSRELFIKNSIVGVKKISLWKYIKFKFNRIFEILEDLV